MLETIVFIILGSIFISVFVWFYLCNKLYGLLSREHPETYEAIGKPSLIMNNSIENGILFMKFIFKKNGGN